LAPQDKDPPGDAPHLRQGGIIMVMKFEQPLADDPAYSCENCGSTPLDKFSVPNATVMWHCSQCDLFQKGTLPRVDAYGMTYHQVYHRQRRRKLRTATIRLNRIAACLSFPRPKMLDIGCSVGATLESATRLGWDAHGVDISHDAVNYCRDRGLSCTAIRGPELPYPDETFDVLTAWHVIEHVLDVTKSLAEWYRVLKPGGLLVVETPDADCWKVRSRGTRYRRFWSLDHVYTFSRHNLEPFFQRAGFEIGQYPALGRLSELPVSMSVYAVGYQSMKGLLRATNLSRAFQILSRRPTSQCIEHPVKLVA
jgi:ubiquinone/menaquinone biosynthesis C-methylase UbiE